jgi:hypothetical protein
MIAHRRLHSTTIIGLGCEAELVGLMGRLSG